jgi:NADPH:quinone reductase-like Zn-dependent oxidoreductase
MSAQDTMKAVRIHSFGGPEVLKYQEAARPTPQAGEVLVRVRAAGINPVDVAGRQFPIPGITGAGELPYILGWDVSGEIVALGEGVSEFAIGDTVYGLPRFPGEAGAYAEYLTAPVTDIVPRPQRLSFEEAAAIPMAGLTAWQGLFELADLQPGQTVLITGGSGGVGHLAIQLAKWKGAKVYATTSTPNLAFLHELGADEVIDYTRQPFKEVVKDVDLVFDTIGGDTLKDAFEVVKRGGTIVSTPLQKGIVAVGQELGPKYGVNFKFTNVHTSGEQLAEINKVVEAGKLRPYLDTVLPLDQVAEAHRLSAAGHVRGKVVLAVE